MSEITNYDPIKLENQLCFPLYACSKEIVRLYKPFLDELDLTYTQYLVMMALWEYGCLSVKELGEKLYLDSGTLTPLLKKLEAKGCLEKQRSSEDERSVLVKLMPFGEALKQKALEVPQAMACKVSLPEEEAQVMYRLLYKILGELHHK